MTIRLLLFASYRDLAGRSELSVELPEGATARTLLDTVRAGEEGLRRLPPEPALAVNEEYAGLDAVLRHGDEVALLPPVAGG